MLPLLKFFNASGTVHVQCIGEHLHMCISCLMCAFSTVCLTYPNTACSTYSLLACMAAGGASANATGWACSPCTILREIPVAGVLTLFQIVSPLTHGHCWHIAIHGLEHIHNDLHRHTHRESGCVLAEWLLACAS